MWRWRCNSYGNSDRNQHPCSWHVYSNSNADTNRSSRRNGYVDPRGHSNGDSSANRDTDEVANTDSYVYPHANEPAGLYGNSHRNSDSDAHSDPNRYMECQLEINQRSVVHLRCEYHR
jgi:hypothetical protein